MTPASLEVARQYAGRGWRVFPVVPDGSKRPAIADWPRQASVDRSRLAAWWSGTHRGHDVGICCGPESDLLVIDIDSHKPEADRTFEAWCADHGACPDTCEVLTPKGGRHLYFRWPVGVEPAQNSIGPGVDVQSRGRYVLAPPSTGSTGQDYVWEVSAGPEQIAPAEVPPGWIDAWRSMGSTSAISPACGDDECGDVLRAAGFTLARLDNKGQMHWTRPGKSPRDGISATVWPWPDHHAVIWSSSVPGIKTGYPYRPKQLAEALGLVPPHPAKSDADVELGGGTKLLKPPAVLDEEPERRVRLTSASAIKPKPVKWLWEGRIALGTLALLAGREGIGKSSFAYLLTSWITRGMLPGAFYGTPRSVIIAATEDSWEHTILPRLMAANADLDRVHKVDVETVEGLETSISVPTDLVQLGEAVGEVDAALILLDPLMSRLSANLDTHKDHDVRRALEPLVALADRANVAIVGLIHVNKSGGGDALNMVMGSRAFSAVARAVLYAMNSPEDESVKLLGQPKNNLGRSDLPTLTYRIVGVKVADHEDGEIWTGRVELGEESTLTIGDALAVSNQDPEIRSATEDAQMWLLDYLEHVGGSAPSAAVKASARAAGHSDRTIQRARKNLKLTSESSGFPQTTTWSLPTSIMGGES